MTDATQPVAAAPESRLLKVQFTGNAADFFAIWIVNVLLTVLTLGIWSAWAKVRTKRYFLGNTKLDSVGFEYHATGWQILRGRLLVVGALLIYSMIAEYEPYLGLAILVAYVLATPWLINKSLLFNARATNWRNVRFDFAPRYGRAFMAFFIWPAIGFLSLGVLIPAATRASARYLGNHHRFGISRFSVTPPLGPYYGAAFGFLVITLGIFAIGIAAWSTAHEYALQIWAYNDLNLPIADDWSDIVASLYAIFAYAAAIAVFTFAGPPAQYYRAMTRNVSLNALRLAGQHRFRSALPPIRFMFLALVTTLATLLTLGLAYPWARVTLYRALADSVSVELVGDLDSFVTASGQLGSSFGSEFSDIQDIDVTV